MFFLPHLFFFVLLSIVSCVVKKDNIMLGLMLKCIFYIHCSGFRKDSKYS